MGKIIIELPEDIEEKIKIENSEDVDEILDRLKLRIKRFLFKEKLKEFAGQFDFDIEEADEDEIYERGVYQWMK